jgi:hypothetical protein
MLAKALNHTETLRVAVSMFFGDPECDDDIEDMDCLDFINLKCPSKNRHQKKRSPLI